MAADGKRKIFPAVTEKEGGISMRQDSRKTTADMITMEEYLKKRQAIKKQQDTVRTAVSYTHLTLPTKLEV